MKAIGVAVMLAAAAAGAGESQMAQAMLAAHNQARAQVGVGPLEWSNKLAAEAEQWARHLIATGTFAHKQGTTYNQNIFEVTGVRMTPREVVKRWASEKAYYNHEQNRCSKGKDCGHYTQIVWRKTKQVGCGAAAKGNRQVWVCDYFPPGNWVGERPY